MNRLLIEIEPALLRYARKNSRYNLEQASKKAKIKKEKLESLESEKGKLSISQIEKLCLVYKVPLAFFLLQEPPHDLIEPKDFRIIYEAGDSGLSPNAYLAIRRARYVQSVIQEFSSKEYTYDLPSSNLEQDPEISAQEFRKILNISIDTQKKWYNSNEALNSWRNAIESLGIFVLQSTLQKDEMSAFCLADKKPYIIVLNSGEHHNRRIFSLFHEIGHLVLHKSGVCKPDDLSRNSFEYVRIEKFCNQFAASFLLPSAEFLSYNEVGVLSKTQVDDWEQEQIDNIARYFKVSREVVLRRFATLNIISNQTYDKIKDKFKSKFDENKKKKEIRIPEYRKCLSRNGKAFSSFILEQLSSNKISYADVSDFLNVNSKHLPKVEAEIR